VDVERGHVARRDLDHVDEAVAALGRGGVGQDAAAGAEEAETLLGQAGAIEADLAALAQGDAGRVRLAGFYTAWSTFLPDAIAAFARAHPRVVLEFVQADPPAAMRGLRAGDLDLAVIFRFEPGDPAADPGAPFVSTRLAHDPYALAVPAGGPLARKRRLAAADLASARWCTAPLGTAAAEIVQRYCREHGGFEPDLAYPTDDVAMAQPLVAAGLAVAFLPSMELARPYPGVAVRGLPHAPPGREVWCLQPANRRLPAARAMVARLQAAARGLAGVPG
jgi:DNA-binding transcriptional LysR family regulator